MQFSQTDLERRLSSLPAEEREAELFRLWREFRASPYFDFVRLCLRDIERRALETIRAQSTEARPSALVTLSVVDGIRRAFDRFDQEPVDWKDEESW